MKMNLILGAAAITLTFTASAAFAKPPEGEGRPARKAPPLVAALDADHDGVISAEEIVRAPAALASLDENGDGQLTVDEIRPEGGRPGKRDRKAKE